MKRVLGIGRGRAGRVGLVAGVVVAAVVGLSAPAFAHHSNVSGQTSCSDGTHVVTWSISNSEATRQMTITSATAKIGSTDYGVSGYANPVGNGGTTSATSVVPGGTAGTIVLTVNVSWPDHYTYQATGQVTLLSNCGTTTTMATTTTLPETTTTQHRCECTTTTLPETTTTHETTTTIAETTTTLPVTTTSEVHELGSTTIYTTTSTQPKHHTPSTVQHLGSTIVVPTTAPSSTATAVLPHTGSSTTIPAIFGGICIAAGAALGLRKRKDWRP